MNRRILVNKLCQWIFMSIFVESFRQRGGIPLGYGLVGMWVGFALDENIRGVVLLRRWRSGKWRDKGFVKTREM